jgi:hypothetical protein
MGCAVPSLVPSCTNSSAGWPGLSLTPRQPPRHRRALRPPPGLHLSERVNPARPARRVCWSGSAPSPDLPGDPHEPPRQPLDSPLPGHHGHSSCEPWLPGTGPSASCPPSQGILCITALRALVRTDRPSFHTPSSPRCADIRLRGPRKSSRQAAQVGLKSHTGRRSASVQHRCCGCGAPQQLLFVRSTGFTKG